MSKPGATREKLIQVAFDLVWDSSYWAVSVADICERAGVQKGSFYHFFASKTDLVVEAYEQHWKEIRPEMDRIFSSQVPPLERITNWCNKMLAVQEEKAEKYGHVCGCPFASVGAEVATSDEKIRRKSEQLMSSAMKYVETAIADAIRAGLVTTVDPVQATRRVYSTATGMMVQAKVENNLDILRDLEPTILKLIGAKTVPV